MSEKDRLNQRKIFNEALKESFNKMLELKKKLGQSIVTSDKNGNPIVISAEEAEELISKKGISL
ncbi:MAG: hypothetical protein K2M67_01660 [Muribaculaceae bacterium]|nr:hypothetical protein [Muribaculaceae bacterium]